MADACGPSSASAFENFFCGGILQLEQWLRHGPQRIGDFMLQPQPYTSG
jgi:hypothetical protein